MRHRHLTRYQLSLVAVAVTALTLLGIWEFEDDLLRSAIGILWFVVMGFLMATIKRRNPRW